jgi:PII-like signaling protein
MRRLEGDQVLLRIFLGESDRVGHRPAWEAVLELLRGEGLAGASVLRGHAGFGASSVIHTEKLLELSADLPVLIEAVDSQEHVDRVLPKLETLIGHCGILITMEKVRVIRYVQRAP